MWSVLVGGCGGGFSLGGERRGGGVGVHIHCSHSYHLLFIGME